MISRVSVVNRRPTLLVRMMPTPAAFPRSVISFTCVARGLGYQRSNSAHPWRAEWLLFKILLSGRRSNPKKNRKRATFSRSWCSAGLAYSALCRSCFSTSTFQVTGSKAQRSSSGCTQDDKWASTAPPLGCGALYERRDRRRDIPMNTSPIRRGRSRSKASTERRDVRAAPHQTGSFAHSAWERALLGSGLFDDIDHFFKMLEAHVRNRSER